MKEAIFFKKKGFYKIKVFTKKEINEIIDVLVKRLNSIANKRLFNHKNIGSLHKILDNNKAYKKIVNSSTRFITIRNNKISKLKNNKVLSNILNDYWKHKNFKIIWVGNPDKLELKKNRIGFRIARPLNKTDAAPPHVDSYNKDKKSFVSLWVPILGFNKKYTCKFFPGTHDLDHKNKDFLNSSNYISKTFSRKYINKFTSFRPSLKIGEAILFHHNLIHGGSDNLGVKTRFSIEFRIFNKKKYNLKQTFDRNFK